MKTYYRGDGEPEITIVGSVHGDEPAGRKAIERILDQDLEFKKPVQFIVANEKALEEDVRFLDVDLNRAFPGDTESEKHEDRLAARLLSKIGETKVLDLHTTRSYPKPFATVKDPEGEKEYLEAANIDKAVHFPNDSGVMTEFVEGIVVETGLQKSDKAVKNAVGIIENFLAYYGVVDSGYETGSPVIYRYYETVEGDWNFRAENFEKVSKGEVYASREDEELVAEEDFYPALMSTKGYDGRLGFKTEKV